MTWALQNEEAGAGASQTFIGSVTAGNLVVVVVTCSGAISSVTDTAGGNTYTLATSGTNSTSGQTTSIYYSIIVNGGAFTVTANGSLTMPVMSAAEYSFTSGTVSLASVNSGSGTGQQAFGAYLYFPVQPAFVLSAVGYDSTVSFTASPGYTSLLETLYSAGVNYGQFNLIQGSLFTPDGTASPALSGGFFSSVTDWSIASIVFVSSGDTTPSTSSTPFSQVYAGSLSSRLNASHY